MVTKLYEMTANV